MSRFWTAAALAVCVCIPAHADGIPAALVPPGPQLLLPTPNIPSADNTENLARPAALPRFASDATGMADIVGRQANISNFGVLCGPSLAVAPMRDAMVKVTLDAPCLPSSVIEVSHGGLSFTQDLSMSGATEFTIPALQVAAQISVRLSDGSTLSAATHIPEVAGFARVALQWDGIDPGELVSVAPKVLDGDIFRLGSAKGDDGRVLHVFSRRLGDVTRSGVVRLSMRSDITPNNCGLDHAARVLRAVPGEPETLYDVTLRARDCADVGQTLELKNVLQDLKLTAN